MTNKEIYLRLLGYSRPYLWRIVLSLIFSLVVAGSDLAYINLIEPLVDKIIAAGNRDLAYLVPIVIIGLAITEGIGRFYQEYYIKTAGHRTFVMGSLASPCICRWAFMLMKLQDV